jgi:hypothetical protein
MFVRVMASICISSGTVCISNSPKIRLEVDDCNCSINCEPKAIPKNFEGDFADELLFYFLESALKLSDSLIPSLELKCFCLPLFYRVVIRRELDP